MGKWVNGVNYQPLNGQKNLAVKKISGDNNGAVLPVSRKRHQPIETLLSDSHSVDSQQTRIKAKIMFYSDVTSMLKALQGKKEVDTGHSVFL